MTDQIDAAKAAARAGGLRYATDSGPGITRRRSGRGFTYLDPDGKRIRDKEAIARIRSIAIPPAWTDVWICPWPNGHIQATGRDARGRKQYRYHAAWRDRRGADKFDRMIDFAAALPRLRRRCDADLRRPGLPREKVLAAVVRLLELTLIRVGNEAYARLNRSFGLTTLRDHHAKIRGAEIRFRFRSKSGVMREAGLRDRRLAAIVKTSQELPGQELFQYVDEDGDTHDIASDDVNDYIREATGGDFTAKDVRTWAGTVLTYRALRRQAVVDDERVSRRNVVAAIKATAEQLGNTPAVARGSYVHPAVGEAYLAGSLGDARRRGGASKDDQDPGSEGPRVMWSDLPRRAEELAVLRLLKETRTDPRRENAKPSRRSKVR